MSISQTKQYTETTDSRIRESSIYELKLLVRLARDKSISLASLMNNRYLSTIDIMLLDSAFKELDLEKADKTLLITKDKYITMLHKLIWVLIETLTKKL